MKKIFLIMMTVTTALVMTACSGKVTNQTSSEDYKYSSYVYDDNAPQYYMSDNAAASETGYYYIAGAPVNNNRNSYIYYYDMVKDMTIPLCSKIDCDHRTEECEAYMSEDACLGNKIWYHNQRLYMIERTTEKDILVSYDKTMRDKKEEKTLSINGLSVYKYDNSACLTNGKLYYLVSGDNQRYLCAVPIDTDEQAYIVKQYASEYHYDERLLLYPIEDKLYVNWLSGISADEYRYYTEQIDVSTDKVVIQCNMNEKYPEIASTIIYTEWCIQSRFDSDGNIYFACVGDNKYIVRKLNISTGDIKDIYSQEMQHEKDYRYVSLKNYDGKYLYIYKNVNGEALAEKSIEEKRKKYDNNIYILDTDGNVKDTVTLNGTDDTAGGNIPGEFYGGDDRCLLIVFSKYGIKGLELSEEKTALRTELIEEGRKNKNGGPVISISAILDKSQIGSGAITLEQITPE